MYSHALHVEEPKVEVISLVDSKKLMKHIERIGRTCYKSEDKIDNDSYKKFIRGLIARKHDAMLEHAVVSVHFYTDRGVTHEIVRHRVASFAQSSTRYCNYSKEQFGGGIHVIKPDYFDESEPCKKVKKFDGTEVELTSFDVWFLSMQVSNWAYCTLTEEYGKTPQEARSVLPQSTAADIYVTANIREWRHIFNLRALGSTGAPHPDIRKVMLIALVQMYKEFPILFEDIVEACNEAKLLENIPM